jgi:hypothetical protein
VNLYVLAKQTSDIAAANGFDAPTFDNLPTKVAFAMTELCEAADAKDDRTAFTEELVDAVMRILGILYPVWGDDWTASRVEQRRRPPPGVFCVAFDPVEVLLFAPFRHLCRAVEDWRHNLRGDVKIDLELALLGAVAPGGLFGPGPRLVDRAEAREEQGARASARQSEERGMTFGDDEPGSLFDDEVEPEEEVDVFEPDEAREDEVEEDRPTDFDDPPLDEDFDDDGVIEDDDLPYEKVMRAT